MPAPGHLFADRIRDTCSLILAIEDQHCRTAGEVAPSSTSTEMPLEIALPFAQVFMLSSIAPGPIRPRGRGLTDQRRSKTWLPTARFRTSPIAALRSRPSRTSPHPPFGTKRCGPTSRASGSAPASRPPTVGIVWLRLQECPRDQDSTMCYRTPPEARRPGRSPSVTRPDTEAPTRSNVIFPSLFDQKMSRREVRHLVESTRMAVLDAAALRGR